MVVKFISGNTFASCVPYFQEQRKLDTITTFLFSCYMTSKRYPKHPLPSRKAEQMYVPCEAPKQHKTHGTLMLTVSSFPLYTMGVCPVASQAVHHYRCCM
jgi:uncharacterized protein involved in cysteine biosynthesis